MLPDSFHLSDQDLLLRADGELPPRRAAAAEKHLSACWTCRARAAGLESAIAEFVTVYRHASGAEPPPIDGPRALLKARLAGSADSTAAESKWIHPRYARLAGMAAALLVLVLFGIKFGPHRLPSHIQIGAVPNGALTPGAIHPVSMREVCDSDESSNDPAVPSPLKRQVLEEYGLNDSSARAYEIDYLVNPQLGGAADIRNLWPQPALAAVWNARTKDALENHLHRLVCSGQLDLGTAQREISQNWVAAYKKYFPAQPAN